MNRAAAVAALLVVTLGGFYAANHVYWDRFAAVLRSGGAGDVDSYTPTEDVVGGHKGFFAVAPPEDRTIPEEALAEARAYAGENASSSLMIWHQGRLQTADYWGGASADTPVNSRSLHKMLGGLVIATAIKNGFIASLDDPVAKYVTEWQGSPKDKITIRNVLQMSSELMWFRGGGPYSLASRRYLDPSWDDILLHRVPLEFTPGSAYDYSDITADVMPHIVERATGQRYASYLSEAVLKPIGAAGGKVWLNRDGGMPHGGCCLMLPPETWLRVGILALNQGMADGRDLFPDGWMDEWLKPSPNNPHFGLMVWLGQPFAQRRLYHRPNSPNNALPRPGAFHSEPYLADDLFLFDGMNGQIVYVIPSRELVIVRTGLRPPRNKPEWDNSILPNIVLRALGAGSVKVAAEAPKPATPSVATGAEGEIRFWKRWLTIQGQTPTTYPEWIDLRETVAGGKPNEMSESPGGAFGSAVAYAETMKSRSLIIWQGGNIRLEKYWLGADRDAVSETYSMAKSMLALAVGAAVDRGAVRSVDDAAADYIAEWKGTAKQSLSIRHFLEMTSGLRHHRFNFALGQSPWNVGLRAFLGPDISGDVLAFPLDQVPGAGFNYNSANTQVLLSVLERATGRRYADFVSEAIWKPLGAKDATLWLDRPGGTAKAFSYFHARPIDWLKVGILIAHDGAYEGRQIISRDWIQQMTTPSAKNPNYGFQIWLGSPKSGRRVYNRSTPASVVHSAPYAAADVIFFDGGGGHRVYVVPSRDLVIVRTGSVNRPDWDDAILPNAVLADLP